MGQKIGKKGFSAINLVSVEKGKLLVYHKPNRPFLHKDFGCPEACLMAAPSGCSVFQLYLNSRK